MMRHVAWELLGWKKLMGGTGVLCCLAGCYNAPHNSAKLQGVAPLVAQATEGDRYVYYPAYEVYYNETRHQYVYRDGRSWVDRPDLPNVWAKQLASTPQVAMDFHDAPEKHHAMIARNFPKTWHSETSKNTVSDATR